MPFSKKPKTQLPPPNMNLPLLPMRPNSSISSTPISWSTPKPTRRAIVQPEPESSILPSVFRSKSRMKPAQRRPPHPEDDAFYVRAMEVPISKPSEIKQPSISIPAISDARNVFLSKNGLECLAPKASASSEGQGNPFEKMVLWDLNPEYKDWHGRYCVWFSKGQENFYVLKLGQTIEYKGRKIPMYESVLELLSPGERWLAIDQWMGYIATYLQNYEGFPRPPENKIQK